jgi:hypothetical protein
MKKWPKKMMFCRQDSAQPTEFHANKNKYGHKCVAYVNGKCAYDNRPCIVHEYVKVNP